MISRKFSLILWLSLSFAWLGACVRPVPHCEETRSCVAAIGFVDAGSFDWGDAGFGGDTAGSAGFGGGTAGFGGDTAVAASSAEADQGGAQGSARDRDVLGGEAGRTGTDDIDGEEPPRIIQVEPSNGAIAVAADASIVITFDQPMNEASVLAAFTSKDLPLSALDASFDARHTVLSLQPKRLLSYATDAVELGQRPQLPAKLYTFGFSDGAFSDTGEALPKASFHFSTLHQVSLDLPADPTRSGNWTAGEGEGIHNCLRAPRSNYVPTICIGDDASNVRYTGFLSFDLTQLPDDARKIVSARLLANGVVNGDPSTLGASQLEHVVFSELEASALATPPLESLGQFLAPSSLTRRREFELACDLTGAVAADYDETENSVAVRMTQYRLTFETIAVNGLWDDVELPTSSVVLALTYLSP